MPDRPTRFQVRSAQIGVIALVAIVLITCIMTAEILYRFVNDYNNGQFTRYSLAPLSWLIPLYPCFLALLKLRRVMFRFAEGEVFSLVNATDLRSVGTNAMITVAMMVFLVPGIYEVIGGDWSGGWRIDLEPGDLASLFLSWVVWLFGRLISEGAKLQSENESFV